MKKRPILKWIALIVIITIIFLLSNDPNSSTTTTGVLKSILPLPNSVIKIINFLVRKLAHITEFFILTIIIISILKEYTKKEKIIIIFSIITCFICAYIDEFHQAFIPGRTSQFIDVLIDTSGGILGVLFYLYIIKKRSRN